MTPDYTVVAVDAPAAERITATLRAAGTGGTVAELDGFTTSAPPPDGPLQPEHDPAAAAAEIPTPWMRWAECRGTGSRRSAASSTTSTPNSSCSAGTCTTPAPSGRCRRSTSTECGRSDRIWPAMATSRCSRSISAISTPRRVTCVDEFGRGKAARDCTADEIATEVWRQIVDALTSDADTSPEAILPWPAWYALDRGLIMAGGRTGRGRAGSQRDAVPGSRSSATGQIGPAATPGIRTARPGPPADRGLVAARISSERNVWQARHGGYQVHHNSVVFAGTWTKTFTRMTSMEAACESGRHAVNAILDHYVWVGIGRCRSSGEHHARLEVSLRLPRSGFVEPDSDADTGR